MVKFNSDGLIPAIVQDARTGEVVMLAYMNEESLQKTLETGQAWFWSRSRRELWHKGATSGNFINVRKVLTDCDSDTILLVADPVGPTCHTGARSCFYTEIGRDAGESTHLDPSFQHILDELAGVIEARQAERPAGSYTVKLLDAGVKRVAQKVGEEAVETVIAACDGDPAHTAAEVADLLYHTLVLLQATGIEPEAVWEELRRRRG